MNRCVELAKKAFGNTYPNPLVGCVIVHNDSIIAEGWHKKAGEAHAEVNAINALQDEYLIKESTLYVSLEPCSHFGKTPPCADLIVNKGFKKVVVGMTDPFSEVSGRGLQKLIKNGCDLIIGVLEKNCQELNKRFITYHKHKRPYIILKWAESQDGFLSPYTYETDYNKNQQPVWLTNSSSKQLVHQWRSEEQAILVGKHTAIMDNPALTTRLWKGANPLRVLIDRKLEVPSLAKIFSEESNTLVFTEKDRSLNRNKHIENVRLDFRKELVPQMIDELYNRGIQSLIVEGGKQTLESFIKLKLWDEARVFKSPKILSKGTKAPNFKAESYSSQNILDDKLITFQNTI